MAKVGKNFKNAKAQVEKGKAYDAKEAIALTKQLKFA